MFSSDNLADDIAGNIRKQRHEHSPTMPQKNESENGRAPPNLMWFLLWRLPVVLLATQ